jgi:hypothetical protein
MEMFIRVLEDRTEFALAAPEGSRGAELFDQQGQLVEDLRARAYDQSRAQSSTRESSGSTALTRAELVRRLDAIYQTVRVLALSNRPDLEDKFRSPRDINDQALLTLARTYGTDAFPLKADLIKRGLGADFIADLDAAALAFDSALNKRTQVRDLSIAATAEINRLLSHGLRLVRELGVVVRNTYADDPSKLALWDSASHVEKPPRRVRPKSDGNQTPPPTQS